MAGLKYIASTLAVAAVALAQSQQAACGSGGTTTIASNADATGLANCLTYSGSIAIATGTTDNIQLSGVRKITGNLDVNGATQMTSLAATDLQEIGDTFHLEGLTILSTLSFPSLEKVDTIDWNALPALQGLSFTRGVEEISMLNIANTALGSLDGINLQVVDSFMVVNNKYLNKVNMQLGNVTKNLQLSANGDSLAVSFPNLIWAVNVSIRAAESVSLPSLASVNGSLGFYYGSMQNLSAANLTSVGQTLAVVGCDSLANISFPQLTTINGGLQVSNNTKLDDISAFPELAVVGGAIDCAGSFSNASLPSLTNVKGGFNMQSTEDITNDCNHFKSIQGPGKIIKGKFNCIPNSNNPKTLDGSGTSTTSGGSSQTSSSAAHPALIPGATGLLGVVAAIFGML